MKDKQLSSLHPSDFRLAFPRLLRRSLSVDSVPGIVQTAQRGDRFFKDAVTALLIRLMFEKIRQRRNYFHPVLAEEAGQVMLPRLEHDGQVVPHHDARAFSPETDWCNLCALTHSNFGMRRNWKRFLETLDRPLEFLHADELKTRYGISGQPLPVVFKKAGARLELLIDADSINACRTMDDLQQLVEARLD